MGLLSGYKTYIIGGLAFLTAIASFLVGDADLATTLQKAYEALIATGLITLRLGVSKQ